jgi:hypothetical protein
MARRQEKVTLRREDRLDSGSIIRGTIACSPKILDITKHMVRSRVGVKC